MVRSPWPSRLFLVLACGGTLWAQEPNAAELLQKSAAAAEANEAEALQYLYREYIVTTEIDEKGKATNRHTQTWESIRLEGSEYRKLIQRDDRPLTAKQQKEEDERLRKETEERRKPKKGKVKNPVSRTYTFAYVKGDERFFEFRYAGEEIFDGRPAYVLEGTPKSAKPADDHEKQMSLSRLTRWIDKEEFIELGSRLDVTGEGVDARPGSLVALKQQRLEDSTWLVSEIRMLFIFNPRRAGERRQEMVITRSAYHKFAAESRIVE